MGRLESAERRAGAAEAALAQTREELEQTQATSERRLQARRRFRTFSPSLHLESQPADRF